MKTAHPCSWQGQRDAGLFPRCLSSPLSVYAQAELAPSLPSQTMSPSVSSFLAGGSLVASGTELRVAGGSDAASRPRPPTPQRKRAGPWEIRASVTLGALLTNSIVFTALSNK